MLADASKGLIFDIKRDCSEDGPGIRTTVFFKGCPLSCVWCQNPEGISPKPSISYFAERCDPVGCGGYACIDACPLKLTAVNAENKKIQIDHASCDRCDKCFDVCTPRALEPVGNWWTANALVEKILVDKRYFNATGGGVTVSGGEPTMQMDFLHRFLVALKAEEINTGLETSGLFAIHRFRELILPFLDFIFFDLKLIQPEESLRFTGRFNDQIIQNFLFLVNEKTIPVIPRIPLIPGITATEKNLSDMSHFLQSNGIKACELIPYNRLWRDKAITNGIPVHYSLPEDMSQRDEERYVKLFLSQRV